MDLYRRLLAYLVPYKGKFILASICMALVSATSGAAALIIQPILDDIFMRRDQAMLSLLPMGVVAIYLIRGAGRYWASMLMQVIGQQAVRDIRGALFRHLQTLSPGFYSSRQTGQLMSRVTNDVQVIQDSVSIVVYDIVRESLTVVALAGVLFYRDPALALIAVVALPPSGVLIGRLGRALRSVSKTAQERIAALNATLHETITGARVVQAFGMEEYEIRRFNEGNHAYFDATRRMIRINELSSPLLEFIAAVGIAVIIWYGGSQVIEGQTTVGAFFSFMTALFMLFVPISKLSRVYNKIQQALAAAVRIFELMDTQPLITGKPGAPELAPLRHAIEFREVRFEYEEGRPALDSVTFTVRKGQVAAFVGASGAGKTTLVNLIPRFYDVTGGAIAFDEVDIRDVTVRSLRAQIGIVTQETFLFHDTIRNNIAYGRQDAPLEEVERAARAAFAHDFIIETPHGYDSPIGERGVKLSGGQRQRLAIARAIMKDPAVLILDEATSALDTESELMVQRALENLMRGRTVFVIAHRLSTILHADLIVAMDRGAIAEMGTHDELLRRGGVYQKLFELQFKGALNHARRQEAQR
ncbi:MAG: ABC transporter ATP-binding protein [Nitrospinae bacterium]|nr:ABC transporter ATP-binding protein [Nitrospinota bacterium]